MEQINRKNHWNSIYTQKTFTEVSWFQEIPQTSLSILDELNLPPQSKIIDIGGGDSHLVDHLLLRHFSTIDVLDISTIAIEKAKNRLGENAGRINWIDADAATFKPATTYDVWHDRAAFHFLTSPFEIEHYVTAAGHGVKADGYLIIGTFSETGPTKCSGIPITQYSEEKIINLFSPQFHPIRCFTIDHPTPFQTIQNFRFCIFQRKKPE